MSQEIQNSTQPTPNWWVGSRVSLTTFKKIKIKLLKKQKMKKKINYNKVNFSTFYFYVPLKKHFILCNLLMFKNQSYSQ